MENQVVIISEAADLIGKNRKTIYRDIKTGKVTAYSDPTTGVKTIAISELIRVYGELKPQGNKTETVQKSLPETENRTALELLELKNKLALLELDNANLKERLVDKEKNIEDLRAITRLLEHKADEPKADVKKSALMAFLTKDIKLF